MSLSDDLIRHAVWLFTREQDQHDILLRRAVSAAYYALFHRIAGDASATIAPHVSQEVNFRIQRWFDHKTLREMCGRFTSTNLGQPLLGLVGPTASPDLQHVARSVVELQSARHSADYDLGYVFSRDEVQLLVSTSLQAISAWDRIAQSAEANIFILSLLLWKNWEKDRP